MDPHAERPPDCAPAPSSSSVPPSLKVVPTIYPTSPPIQSSLEHFWQTGPEFDEIVVSIRPPESPLAILEQLGPSPFARGEFPLVGFLATTYDKVSRSALARSQEEAHATASEPSKPAKTPASPAPIDGGNREA